MFELIGIYVNRMRSDQAQPKMDEVRQHLDETYFAWMGGTDEESVSSAGERPPRCQDSGFFSILPGPGLVVGATLRGRGLGCPWKVQR